MAEQKWTEPEVMQRLGISREELDRLIAKGHLEPVESEGRRTFTSEQLDSLEVAISEGKRWVDRDAVLGMLGGDREKLNSLLADGTVREYRFGDRARFDVGEVRAAGGGAEEEAFELEVAEEKAEEPFGDFETVVSQPGTPAARPKTEEEEAFFDFTEELAVEEGEERPAEGEAVEFELGEAVPEEEEMHTEIVELEGAEAAEERELLADILEMEEGEGMAEPELTPAAEAVEEVTEELGEEDTEEVSATEEPTAEITKFEEEIYEDEELGEILAETDEEVGVAAMEGEEVAQFEVLQGIPVAAAPVVPVGVGTIVLLLIALILMVVGGLFLVENAIRPEYSTKITEMLSFFD